MRYLKHISAAVLVAASITAAAELSVIPHDIPIHEPPSFICTVTCTGMDGAQVPCGLKGGVCIDTTTLQEAAAMPYATRTDLVDRFGATEIDRLAPADVHGVSPRADAVLADADAEIDAVIAERYDTPLPPGTYPLLKAAACDIARLRLYDDAAPERVLGRGSSARKRVVRVAAGELHLLDANGASVEPRQEAAATSAAPRFGRATFETPGAGSRWDVC